MGQFSQILLAIDNVDIVSERSLKLNLMALSVTVKIIKSY